MESIKVIEDKELGLKVAENMDEVFWNEIIETTSKDIENTEKALKFQRSVLEMAEFKLQETKLQGGENGKDNI